MKKILYSIVVAIIALTVSANQTSTSKGKRIRPPRRPYNPSGGIVEKCYKGKVLRIVNIQKLVSADTIESLTLEMRWAALLPFEVKTENKSDREKPIELANTKVEENNVGAVVIIINDDNWPITLSAPERRWTILNIASIDDDLPTKDRIEERLSKLLWIAVGRTLGAGYSSYKPCVMSPFKNITELDRNPAKKPCPEPFNKMIETGSAYGIRTISISSYRKACEEGWAPAPTNDIQKAIWDKIHATPKNPMKIEFDPKKGR
jgi:predicted Zn-dependent protease